MFLSLTSGSRYQLFNYFQIVELGSGLNKSPWCQFPGKSFHILWFAPTLPPFLPCAPVNEPGDCEHRSPSPLLSPKWKCRCRESIVALGFFLSLLTVLGKLICRQDYALFKSQPRLLKEYIIQIGACGWNSAKLSCDTRGLPMSCPAGSQAAEMPRIRAYNGGKPPGREYSWSQ